MAMVGAQWRNMADFPPLVGWSERDKMNLFFGLLRGYYYPTRKAGHSVIVSVANALRLTLRCLQDKYRRAE